MPKLQSKNKTPIFSLLLICAVILGSTILIYMYRVRTLSIKQVACTMDALVCPDGSSVGRVAPSCNFAPCPSFSPSPTPKGQFCGGIAGKQCPGGYRCILDGKYPDAGGTCQKLAN